MAETKGKGTKTDTGANVTRLTVEEGNLKNVTISANEGGNSVNIAHLIDRFKYSESILDPTIRVQLRYVDTGSALEGKGIIPGLPLVGTEEVRVIMEDANQEKIDVELFVDDINQLGDDQQNSVVDLALVSEEFIQNEDGKKRVNIRFNGKISDHVNKVLTDQRFLNTQKKCSIEPTANVYNCIGVNRKPLAFNLWLQKKGVTTKADNSAGFFLWETSEGYQFKSVDGLFAQESSKKYIWNNIPDESGKNIPKGYDGQILELTSDNNINAKNKLQVGSYTTRIVLFDPFNCHYEIIKPTVKPPAPGSTKGKDSQMKPELAAEELPVKVFNKKFDMDFTRTTYMLWDTGGLPEGKADKQIEKSQEHNLEPEKLVNQASMRYNQMFTLKRSITIAGDFTLHAGDAISIDIPQLQADKMNDDPEGDTLVSGLYIIVDLSHIITANPPTCYTRMNLVRDSLTLPTD